MPSPTKPIDVICTLFHGVRPAVQSVEAQSWADFIAEALPAMLAERRSDKKRLPGFVLALVDGTRTDANTGAHTALAIDVDHIPEGDLGALLKRASRYTCAVYETPSSTDEAPRIRIIAALGAEIPPGDVPAARRELAEALGLDPDACGTAGALPASQVMFAGRIAGTRARGLWTYEGSRGVWAPQRTYTCEAIPPRSSERRGKIGLEGKSYAFAFDTPPDLSAIAKACPPAGRDGDRHTLVRALGGWLARRGYSPALIAEAVAREIPSDDPAERARQAQDAAERVLAGEEAPGWEALQRWASVYGRASTLKRFETACRDPEEPEGFPEVWSAHWRKEWPTIAAFWRTRKGAKARDASAASRTGKAAARKAETRAVNEAQLVERAGEDLAAQLECDDNSQPYSHAANVEAAVAKYFSGAVARDASTGRVHVLAPGVTLQGATGDNVFAPGLWSDIHTTWLHSAVCRIGLKRPARSDVNHAIEALAAKRQYWPVRTFLEGLPPWDGTERSLCAYFGVPEDRHAEYARWVCAAWLRSCVARGMKPGCQVDHVLVLEGEQGTAKSSALRTLAGDEWFGAFTANVKDDKKVGEQLQGKWIVEIAELDKWTRAYSEADLKDVITRRQDDYRAAFGHHAERRDRTAVPAASTNRGSRDGYLTDDTGNRRYWPIETGWFDLAGLNRDREQIWAQALHEYRRHCEAYGASAGDAPGKEGPTGLEWWPATDALREMVRDEQARRLAQDPWEKTVRVWVRDQASSRRAFTSADAAVHGVGLELERVDVRAIARIDRCLLACACVRIHTKSGARAWRRVAEE